VKRLHSRRRRVAVAALLVVALAIVTVSVVPGLRAGAKATALLPEGFGLAVPRPLAPDVERTEERLDGVLGDLYAAGDDAPPVMLLPGAAEDGRADERVITLAGAVARSNRTVFVPELSLFDQRLDVDDLERVVRSTVALSERTGGQPVVMLGFSFGGSLTLVAAADERAQPLVRLVATFGSYIDLIGVMQAVTTGVSIVGEERFGWDVPDTAAEVVPEIAADLVPDDERDALTAALEGGAGAGDDLPPESAAVHALLTNDDPERTFELAEQLGPAAREVLRAYSPAEVADRLTDVPVLAAHSRDDPAVPFAELLRLARVLPHADTLTVDSFDHVDIETGGDPVGLVRDLTTSWAFVRRLLAVQETWPGQG
jgi:pimeloyl-ACP methyl ester carboxylesterase